MHTHDWAWLSDHLPEDGSVTIKNVTASLTCFGVWGPQARDMMAQLVAIDLSTPAMPFLSMRKTSIAGIPVELVRITFVGELGYEIYADTAQGLQLWQTLWQAGRPLGMLACGYKAIDSLRTEKGYLYWGADITPEETPFESGLNFAVAKNKEFKGREALLAKPLTKKLVTIVLNNPHSVVLSNEPVKCAGKLAGRVTSGAYGASTGLSIAFAWLPVELSAAETAVEILVFGNWIKGKIMKGPQYDPKGQKVRN